MEEDSIPVDIEPHYMLIERHLYANRLIQRHHDSWRPIIKDQEWAGAQFLDILPRPQNSWNNPPSWLIKNLATTLYFQAVPIFWDRLNFVYQMCISQGVSPSEQPTFCLWSVQFSRSVEFDSLRPHEPQHTRPPCPSQTPGVYPNPCPSSRWRHPTISSSVVPFSSCPQSFPALESFPMSQLFESGGQSIGVSASTSVLPVNTQD